MLTIVFSLPSWKCIHCFCWNSSSPLFVFAHCMLLNINFTMKIIKNASLAISSEHKKNYFPLDAPFTFIMSRACLYLWHGLINVYLYLCMFCCCYGKSIIYIVRSWNWSATLYNSLYLPKGFGKHPSTYTRRSSETSTHIWGRRDLLLKIKISLFLAREISDSSNIFVSSSELSDKVQSC
jgi:hypothetical protein